MLKLIPLVAALHVLVLAACAQRADPAADEAAIRAADSEMIAAMNARDLDRWLSFVADDVRAMPPNAPTIEGKAAIRTLLAPLLAFPGFSVIHHPGSITVGRGGDLAYASSDYELTMPDSEGEAITVKGKEISIWKKQTDGSWKLSVNMWSPNEPAPL